MRKIKLGLSFLCLGFLLLVGSSVLFTEDRELSEQENRNLTTRPELTVSSIFDTSFQEKFADYLCDQFPLREKLITAKSEIKLLCGIRDFNGTYLGKDGFYFEKVTDEDIDQKRFSNNLGKVESFASKHPETEVHSMLVPSSGTILTSKLPKHAEIYDAQSLVETEEAILTEADVVDVYSTFKEEKHPEELYYKTDHHWTSLGAYEGYQELRKHLKSSSSSSAKALERQVVTSSFYGTLYSKSLDLHGMPDEISLVTEKDLKDSIGEFSVEINGKEASLYDLKALQKKDKYQVFFGGNFGLVKLTTTNPNGKKLLLIKDSFANSLVPYLLQDYQEIVMIDPRFFPGNVEMLMKEETFDDCLFLYELNNFANDTNLVKVGL